MARLDAELMAKLDRLAAGEGVELVAVEVVGTARKPLVRLVLDRDGAGATLEECANVSRQASVLLDAYDPFPGAFTLEVTSPGLERKFYQDKDYVRYAGRAVRVRMRPTWAGNRLIEGTLEGRERGAVRVRDHRGELRELPEAEVFETRLVFQGEPMPRPSTSGDEKKAGGRGRDERAAGFAGASAGRAHARVGARPRRSGGRRPAPRSLEDEKRDAPRGGKKRGLTK